MKALLRIQSLMCQLLQIERKRYEDIARYCDDDADDSFYWKRRKIIHLSTRVDSKWFEAMATLMATCTGTRKEKCENLVLKVEEK